MGVIAQQSIKGTIVTYIGVAVGFLTTFFVLTRFLTAEDISPDTDGAWMRLLLNTAEDDRAWEGYEYILNRETAGVLERSRGGWDWEQVGEVDYAVNGRVLQVCIPKSALGITGDDFVLRFKWADNNLTEDEAGAVDLLDVYSFGDAAPGERYQYRYTAKHS